MNDSRHTSKSRRRRPSGTRYASAAIVCACLVFAVAAFGLWAGGSAAGPAQQPAAVGTSWEEASGQQDAAADAQPAPDPAAAVDAGQDGAYAHPAGPTVDELEPQKVEQMRQDLAGCDYEPDVVLVELPADASAEQLNAQLNELGYLDAAITDQNVAAGYAEVPLAQDVSVAEALAALDENVLVGASQPNFIYYLADDPEPEPGDDPDPADPAPAPEPADPATGGDPEPGTSDPGLQAATLDLPGESNLEAAAAATDDPYLSDQWALEAIHAPEAWEMVKGQDPEPGHRVAVAILDSGIREDHEDLAANVIPGSPYNVLTKGTSVADDTNNYHGTHVAGIISAASNNGKGVSGVTYNAPIVPVKVIKADKSTTSTAIYDGFSYVLENAEKYNIRVVNVSIAGKQDTVSGTGPNRTTDRLCLKAMKQATDAEILVVTAAGNSGTNAAVPYSSFPCDYYEGAIGVINAGVKDGADDTAEDRDKYVRNDSSNYNRAGQASKELSAPGTNIYSTVGGSDKAYGNLTGTSMAAPYVAGVAALVFTAAPELTPQRVSSILYSTATDLGADGFDADTGFGLVNAEAAVETATKYPNYLESEDGLSVLAGESIKLGPGGGSVVGWISSDNVIATVDGGTITGGTVNGLVGGSVAITGTGAGLKLSQRVFVYDAKFAKSIDSAEYGTKADFELSSVPSGSWTWSVSDPKLASITTSSDLSCTVSFGGSGVYDSEFGVDVIATLDTNPNVQVVQNVQVLPPPELTNDSIRISWPEGVNSFDYTGSAWTPVPTVRMDGYTLKNGVDYSLSYRDNTQAGTATVVIQGINAYEGGQATAEFYIKKSLADRNVTVDGITPQTYTGQELWPEPVVSWGDEVLTRGTDYTLSYKDNKEVGTATITIEGKGKYWGTTTATFQIVSSGSGSSGGSSSSSSSSGGSSSSSSGSGSSQATGSDEHADDHDHDHEGESSSSTSQYSPSYKVAGATVMPVGATASYTLTDCYAQVTSGADHVSFDVTTNTLTAASAGEAQLTIYDRNGITAETRTITVQNLSGNSYYVQSAMNSAKVLDIADKSTADGGNMIIWRKNNGTNQKFRLEYQASDKTYVMRSVKSGKLIDVSGKSKKDGGNVLQWKSNSGANQRWRITVDENNRLSFVNKNSGKLLDVNGAKAVDGRNVLQWRGNGGANQKWTLQAVSADTGSVYEGTYRIAAAAKTSVVLNGKKSKKNGANVTLWKSSGAKNQQWRLVYAGKGLYRIVNANSGKVLDVAGGSWKNGANVRQWASKNTTGQLWKPVRNADGTYTFYRNGNLRYALTAVGGRTANGTNIVQSIANGSKAQKFRLYQY